MNIIQSHDVTLTGKTDHFCIQLIPMTDQHLPLLYKWNTRSEVLYWCEGDDVVTNTEEDVRGIYGSVSQSAFMFMICVDGVLIGEGWLQDMNLPVIKEKHAGKNVKRIDMAIFEKEFWGKGIGSVVNQMLLEFGFSQRNADLIYAITEDYNLRAQKCLTKSGFIFDCQIEHPATSKGKEEDCYFISKEGYGRKS